MCFIEADNKLSGVLLNSIIPAPDLYDLSVNRITGTIPKSLLGPSIYNIRVLEGNVFSCDAARNQLPDHDPDLQKYSCASSSSEQPIYVFIVIMALALAGMYAWHFYHDEHQLVSPRLLCTFSFFTGLEDELEHSFVSRYRCNEYLCVVIYVL